VHHADSVRHIRRRSRSGNRRSAPRTIRIHGCRYLPGSCRNRFHTGYSAQDRRRGARAIGHSACGSRALQDVSACWSTPFAGKINGPMPHRTGASALPVPAPSAQHAEQSVMGRADRVRPRQRQGMGSWYGRGNLRRSGDRPASPLFDDEIGLMGHQTPRDPPPATGNELRHLRSWLLAWRHLAIRRGLAPNVTLSISAIGRT
jgi:hypothetical protein